MSETSAMTIVVLVLLIFPVIGLLGSRLLLVWYLREVSGLKIVEAPDEAIVTYPMA